MNDIGNNMGNIIRNNIGNIIGNNMGNIGNKMGRASKKMLTKKRMS